MRPPLRFTGLVILGVYPLITLLSYLIEPLTTGGPRGSALHS
ncbi:hypothetical protein CLV80_108115 [Yoonia maritima]|uniref:Uncharacterized protein n=1 Tax=Yoonia maritima TaxID=1435347 RepID=A0A2T0VXF0_9RHOB|nr:hypothetical protein CLV80_108115 [Yoonia maritima]